METKTLLKLLYKISDQIVEFYLKDSLRKIKRLKNAVKSNKE